MGRLETTIFATLGEVRRCGDQAFFDRSLHNKEDTSDTELINFPLFCPKCRKETLIHVEKFKVSVITEPDAQTQSR